MTSSEVDEIMLFGVRVSVDPMRKSVSMNDLSQYVQVPLINGNVNGDVTAVITADSGYGSADDAIVRNTAIGARERKRGVPWTEDEHKLFLVGLQKVGKGDWRGISRNFVKTRTPTQVASHAQKYYLRKGNLNRRRRRSSLFDITTVSVATIPMEEQVQEDNIGKAASPQISPQSGFPMAVSPIPSPLPIENQMEIVTFNNREQINTASTLLVRPIPVLPTPSPSTSDLNIIQKHEMNGLSLSLNLSLSYDHTNRMDTSIYQVMPGFNSGDGLISVG